MNERNRAAAPGSLAWSSIGAVAAVLGFALAASFTAIGYAGADSVASKIGFFCILGVVGAVCAACLALAAHVIAHRRSTQGFPLAPRATD
jgi:hypothetical protein